MTDTAIRTFLPWYRRGLPTGLTAQSSRIDGRARVPLSVSVAGRPGTASVPVQLVGPGDVAGLDAHEVRRVHPFDGCATFETGLFPHVELAAPDLPWRHTPMAPDERGHLQPWIALAVVDAATAALAPATEHRLAALSCPAGELPDLADAWAWAHVQVTRTMGQDLEDVIHDMPERAVARLLCPRRLVPQHEYVACVVPTFEAGRLAGLEGDPAQAADPLGPAWGEQGDATLPVYVQWRFSTAEPGSFETLARALRPHRTSSHAATRPIAVHDPGWGVRRADPHEPGATLPMHGLLRTLGAGDLPPSGDPGLRDGIRTAVDQVHERPQVRPPLYGQDHVDRRTVPAAGAEPAWLRDLNLDPRHRLAAGLGAMVVRVLQEDLVAEAWHQLALAHRPPDEEIRMQVADALTSAMDGPRASDGGGAPQPPAAATATSLTLGRLIRPGGPLARRSAALADGPKVATGPPARLRSTAAAATPARSVPRTGFAPRFPRPAYELLTAVHPEWVLPGITDLPPDSVSPVETNAAFVEAFLVGLNYELGRELVWRRYPVDRAGTFFGAFWPAVGDAASAADIAEWTGGALGAHVEAAGALVLLVRGELLRRYPQTQVYAVRGAADGEPIVPTFTGRWGEDVTLVGFPLTADEAFADGGDLWFVIEEAAQWARFGCDEANAAAPTRPAVWQDLQWGNADFDERTHLPAQGPLAGVDLPVVGGPDGGAAERATWGADAAHMAVITQQPPLRAVLPARRWRPPPQQPEPDR